MPPLLPVILAGAAMYGAYRWVRHQLEQQAARAAEELRRHASAPRDLGRLELDPATGLYRPRES